MSVKHPSKPDDFFRITKRTAAFIAICIVSALFTMGLGMYGFYNAYHDARDDLADARRENQCSRQINADSLVAIGEVVSQLGEQGTQIGNTFAALPTIQANPSTFQSLVQGFAPIAAQLDHLQSILDEQLKKQADVNVICVNKEGTAS